MNSEVTRENLPHNNRKFGIRFVGECQMLVKREADQARDNMDLMASPSVGAMYRHGQFWACDLTWYSVD